MYECISAVSLFQIQVFHWNSIVVQSTQICEIQNYIFLSYKYVKAWYYYLTKN